MANATIKTIQNNFDKQKKEVNSKIADLKKNLDPERLGIKEELKGLANTISTKKALLKNLESTKKNLTNLINQQKAVNVTPEDMSRWQERLSSLSTQIAPLKQEVIELQNKLKFSELKLIALKQ